MFADARRGDVPPELVPVLTRFQPKPYPLHLAYPPNRHVSNRLRVFIDWAVQAFARSMA